MSSRARHPRRARRFQRGFTLLEAIVAMTIFSLVGMALYAWLNQSVQAIANAERAQLQAASMRNALAFIDTVNPMQRPEGHVELGETRLVWESEVLRQSRPGLTLRGGTGHHNVALYRVLITVYHEDREVERFELHRAGWEYDHDRMMRELSY